tara:strand:+ start:392 stop:868 length:477 start_codon:yes stop_codon:yes gene_type:complete
MNAYSELLNYIKGLAKQDYYVSTVTTRLPDDIDIEKNNIFPIFNISALDGVFLTDSVVRFNVVLSCVDIRDFNNEDNTDKFYQNDNEVDNHNNTLTTLQGVWVKMNRDFAENNITASDNPTFRQIQHQRLNVVDGWELSFQVEMPMDGAGLCDVEIKQ